MLIFNIKSTKYQNIYFFFSGYKTIIFYNKNGPSFTRTSNTALNLSYKNQLFKNQFSTKFYFGCPLLNIKTSLVVWKVFVYTQSIIAFWLYQFKAWFRKNNSWTIGLNTLHNVTSGHLFNLSPKHCSLQSLFAQLCILAENTDYTRNYMESDVGLICFHHRDILREMQTVNISG